VLAATSAVLVLAPLQRAGAAESIGGPPGPQYYEYSTRYRYDQCSYSSRLTSAKNTTSVPGVVTVGQQVGSSYTFSGTAGGSVGDTNKLTATIGFSYTRSVTVSASGQFTLQPGQTLSLYKLYDAVGVTQTFIRPGVPNSVSSFEVRRPIGVCFGIN
jgi:hypothetical protein